MQSKGEREITPGAVHTKQMQFYHGAHCEIGFCLDFHTSNEKINTGITQEKWSGVNSLATLQGCNLFDRFAHNMKPWVQILSVKTAVVLLHIFLRIETETLTENLCPRYNNVQRSTVIRYNCDILVSFTYHHKTRWRQSHHPVHLANSRPHNFRNWTSSADRTSCVSLPERHCCSRQRPDNYNLKKKYQTIETSKMYS